MRVVVFQTISGRIVADLPFTGVPQWSFGLSARGTWAVDVPTAGIEKSLLSNLLYGYLWSIAICYGNEVLQAGPIISADFRDDGSNVVTLGGAGLWAIYDARVTINSGWVAGQSIAAPAADLGMGPQALHTLAKYLVTNDYARPGHVVPVTWPDDIAGPDVRNYTGYDLAPVGQRLDELTKVEGGPDVEFRPRWSDNTQTQIYWEMRIGNPQLGNLGAPHAWDYGRGLTQLGVGIDASNLETTHFTRGGGTDRASLFGYAASTELTSVGFPALERVDGDHTSASTQSVLDSWASAHLATYGQQVSIKTATVRMDGTDGSQATGSPSIDLLSAGDTGVFNVMKHSILMRGQYPVRVMGVSQGPDIHTAVLTVQDATS
jgi:hypothetical protein